MFTNISELKLLLIGEINISSADSGRKRQRDMGIRLQIGRERGIGLRERRDSYPSSNYRTTPHVRRRASISSLLQ